MQPAVDDRRLTNRMVAKWWGICKGERMPRRAEITPEAFGADWANCTVIALDAVLWRSRLDYVGDALRNRDRATGVPQILNDYAEGSLVRLVAAKIPALLQQRVPVIFGDTALHGGRAMLYRAVVLPVSEDNERIDHILGAINYRLVSVEEEDSVGASPQTAAAHGEAEQVSSFFALTAGRIAFPQTTEKRRLQVTIKKDPK